MNLSDRSVSPLILLASGIGVLSFLYPFLLPVLGQADQIEGRGVEVSLLFALLAMVCLLAIVLEVQGRATGQGPSASKMVALLGVLVAIDSTLRLIPSLLGASPVYLLIILVGFCYGPNLGFLMGALTLLVSAFLTGGIGPWLPFQMLTAGWLGLTAGWLPRPRGYREIALLAIFGGIWGFLFGAIMNLWSWPFAAPGLEQDVGIYWIPGMTTAETLYTYGRFYLVTSLVYDLFRALGNIVLIVLLARPIIDLLDRFRERFTWQPWAAFDDVVELPLAPIQGNHRGLPLQE